MPTHDPHPRTPTADEDLDLPPLDGGAEDEREIEGVEIDTPQDEGGLDDTVVGDEAFATLDHDVSEAVTLEGTDPAKDLDVGAADTFAEGDGSVAGVDAPGIPEEDLDIAEESLASDGGEEGPAADDEAPDPGDLPRLDDDGEGEDPLDLFFDGRAIGRDELPRAERPYDPWFSAETPAAPVVLVAAEGSAFALAASGTGEVLSIREDGTRVLARNARAVAYDDGVLYVMTKAGLLVSRDGGRAFETLAAAREGRLLVAEGRPWLLSPRGELFVLGAIDNLWQPARTRVLACNASPHGKLAFLAQGDSSLWLSARGRSMPVPEIAGVLGLLVAPNADGPIAVHTTSGVHVLSGDTWSRLPHSGEATAIAYAPDPGGGILFGRCFGAASTVIVRAGAAGGEGDIVCELPGDTRVTALAVMAGVVWAGGDFGVVAVRIPEIRR